MFASLLVACLALSCDSGGDDPASAGLSLNESGSTVLVDDSWTACGVTADCIRAGTSCDGCCGEVAITASLQEDYQTAKAGLCEDYEGGVCDCAPLATSVECIQQSCTLVPE